MSTLTTVENNAALQSSSLRSFRVISVCFVLSGATGLIYEVLWARMLGLVFGATTLAVSTVLAAFMAGLALGSALAGRVGAKIRRPLRLYGLLEIGIAVCAIAVPPLFSWVDKLYLFIWQQLHPGFVTFSLWRFALSCVLLLPPTTLMGATLPVLAAALVRSPNFKATSVARLYTLNLIGAIAGTIAAGFFFLPMLGVRATIHTAVAVNLIIGIAALLADRLNQEANSAERKTLVGTSHSDLILAISTQLEDRRFWLFCAFISGFVTISTQVAWTRVLTMIIGSSTYAFSIVVALFLAGLSYGAYMVGRKQYSGRLRHTLVKVESMTALSLFLSLSTVTWLPELLVRAGLGLKISSWVGLLALQIAAGALIVLLPAFLMGTVMPLVLVWASEHDPANSIQLVGRSYAVNTIGAIAGAFAAGFLLVPHGSTRFTILFGAALCTIVAGFAYLPGNSVRDADVRRALVIGLSFTLAVVIGFVAPAFNIPRMNLSDLSIGAFDSLIRELAHSREIGDDTYKKGPVVHKLLLYEEGQTSTVSVRKDWNTISMAINGRTNASDLGDMPTQVMLGQLPLLLAPSINNGLVVGFASGVSVGAVLQSPIESLECVELEHATIRGSRFFEHVNNHPLDDPRLHLIIDDARSHLRVVSTRYDMIISEPSHPWVPGVANLFTKEFFELGRDRLAAHGVFVQWVQIYQLSTESLRSVLATYHTVFPHLMLFRVGGLAKGKDLILVGSKVPLSLSLIGERMRNVQIAAELHRVAMNSEADVRAWYVCDEGKLGPAVAGAVINTDDNMHIETTVPREAFLPLMQSNSSWVEALTK